MVGGWISLSGIAYLHHQDETIRTHGLPAVVIVLLVISGAVNLYRHHGPDVARYAVRTNVSKSDGDAWYVAEP